MLLQNVRDYAILTLNPLGRITSWNTGARGIFGYDEHEIVGQEGRVLFTPQDRAENVPEQELATAAREGRASDDRWQLRKDGTVFWASGVAMPMRDPDGTLRGFNKVLRDLTQAKVLDEHRDRLLEQEKTARLEAERAITMKDEFIAVVSHELRTPLTSVILWAGMLRSGTMKQSEMDEALEIIERSAAAQQQLIDDLLDVSRMLSGKLRIKILEIDLVPSLQAAIDAVRPMALTKNIAIESILDERAGRVSADPDRIQQVLWNLLNNAVKFTPAGGKVTVQLDRIDDTLQIKVADTGRGISHSFLPFVFDRFRQADSSSTRRYGGLGLGLAITRQLVELHGGTIRAESPGEGKGTTFIIELPLADVRLTAQSDSHRIEQPHGSSQHSARPDLSGRRILIVEDESDTRLALKKLLQQCQAVVAAVDSAAAAIALLQQSPGTSSFDVLISDIGMPGEDGYQLIRQVRAMERAAKTLSTPAIALSAYAREEDRLKAVSAGFQAHVAKPVKPSELLEVLVSLTLTSRKGNAANHHNP
jgi:PAS domain S-box-containing protein